jgi:hypothetical protein
MGVLIFAGVMVALYAGTFWLEKHFEKDELEPECMSCGQRKPVADFDRTWEYRGGVFGYCLRCNGKAFTEAENEANRAARLEAVRLKRERHKSRRAALSPEDRAREDRERRIRKGAKTKVSERPE